MFQLSRPVGPRPGSLNHPSMARQKKTEREREGEREKSKDIARVLVTRIHVSTGPEIPSFFTTCVEVLNSARKQAAVVRDLRVAHGSRPTSSWPAQTQTTES